MIFDSSKNKLQRFPDRLFVPGAPSVSINSTRNTCFQVRAPCVSCPALVEGLPQKEEVLPRHLPSAPDWFEDSGTLHRGPATELCDRGSCSRQNSHMYFFNVCIQIFYTIYIFAHPFSSPSSCMHVSMGIDAYTYRLIHIYI